MYTKCPKCSTVFRITAAQLRAADGEVRCGNCTISFNALTELTDELPELTDAVVVETNKKPEAAPQTDVGSQTTSDDQENQDQEGPETSDAAATNLEFDAPEMSWSKFFASSGPDTGPNAERERTVEHDEADESFELANEPEHEISPLELETADPDEWKEFLVELSDDDIGTADAEALAESEDSTGSLEDGQDDDGVENGDSIGDQPGIVVTSGIDEGEGLPGYQVELENELDYTESTPEPPLVVVDSSSEFDADNNAVDEPQQFLPEAANELAADSGVGEYLDHRAHELSALFDDEHEGVEDASEPEKKVSWWSLTLSTLLSIAFLSQLVHYNRDSLAAHPEYGGIVRNIYARIESPLYPEWTLSAFRVRGTEAVAGRSSKSALDILATIEIVGAEPVGLPLVRIALQDRWANPVASRVFYPSEYLQTDKVPVVLSKGMTLPVEVSVIDPGTAAQNYVIDVCIPSRSRGLRCQLLRNPFQS